MVRVAVQENRKPAEMEPQRASFSTVASLDESNIDQAEVICQEFLSRFREDVESLFITAYEATLAEQERCTRELSIKQRELRQMEATLEAMHERASHRERVFGRALAGFRAQAEQAAALMVDKGILAPAEANHRVMGALLELQAKLEQDQRGSQSLAQATRKQASELREHVNQEYDTVTALNARLAELREVPAVAQHVTALEDKRRRQKEQADAAIRFLRTARWGDLSRGRTITAALSQAQVVSLENLAVFDALVDRLSAEMERIGAMPPAIAWSVIRTIGQLGLQEMFPDLSDKRAALANQARAHKQGKRAESSDGLSEKVVSLASRWGARLAGFR